MSGIALGLILLVGASLGMSLIAIRRDKALNWDFQTATPESQVGADPVFEKVFEHLTPTATAHSPSIILGKNGFSLVWFQGSAEAKADVQVVKTQVSYGSTGWVHTPPEPHVTSEALGAALMPQQMVVTLGNTIENEAAPGGLFATVASLGGWAAAQLVHLRNHADGSETARKLNVSPFLNRSFLVKSPMVSYADGSMGLPAYFEMGSTYGAMVRFDTQGRVRDIRRMLSRTGAKPIQPMVVPVNSRRAVAFLRDFDPSQRLFISETEDGGQSWSDARRTDVFNQSSPVAALTLRDGQILAAMNDIEDRPDAMSLSLTADAGQNWQRIWTFDEAEGDARYPMMRWLASGDIVLSYSVAGKGGVVAYVFNEAWVTQQ